MALVPLCPADDVWAGAIIGARLPNGHRLALYRIGDEVFATDDTCTHGAASLSEDGTVAGDRVECGWHNGQFDIRTGAACAMPCTEPLKTWPVHIAEGRVWVEGPET
jgi:p-cumate 2,3-dioxygenase ferredoxin subunit